MTCGIVRFKKSERPWAGTSPTETGVKAAFNAVYLRSNHLICQGGARYPVVRRQLELGNRTVGAQFFTSFQLPSGTAAKRCTKDSCFKTGHTSEQIISQCHSGLPFRPRQSWSLLCGCRHGCCCVL